MLEHLKQTVQKTQKDTCAHTQEQNKNKQTSVQASGEHSQVNFYFHRANSQQKLPDDT